MATPSVKDLIIEQTKEVIYAFALTVAEATELDTTSWRTGDPTRSLFWVVSELFESLESVSAGFIRAGFLEWATGKWLRILARQVYGYDPDDATYGACTCLLTNAGGGVFDFEAGDLVARSSENGKTYRNTTAGTLDSLGTLELQFAADEAGSASNAAIGEIDELVTTYLGVTIENTTACIGRDDEPEASIKANCKGKIAALSPNGPAEAYTYVALNEALTGDSETTRARAFADSDTNDVLLVLAGDAGGVSGTAVTAVEAACLTWCTPSTTTLTTQSADEVSFDVDYEIWIYESVNLTEDEIKAAIEDAIVAEVGRRPIGGDRKAGDTAGKIYADRIQAVIETTYDEFTFAVEMTGVVDVDLTDTQVGKVGTVTGTVNFVEDP